MSPNINDISVSKFLKKEDVTPPVTATIRAYEQMNVAMENQAPEMKWCLNFHELPKPVVLNKTNGILIATIVGSEDFEAWIGEKVVLYNDASIMFGGKMTGGIRIRSTVQPAGNPIPPDAMNQLPEDTTNYSQEGSQWD